MLNAEQIFKLISQSEADGEISSILAEQIRAFKSRDKNKFFDLFRSAIDSGSAFVAKTLIDIDAESNPVIQRGYLNLVSANPSKTNQGEQVIAAQVKIATHNLLRELKKDKPDARLVAQLIKQGADVNASESYEEVNDRMPITAFGLAVQKDAAIAALLLNDAAFNPNDHDKGRKPLSYLAKYGCAELIHPLVFKGANVKVSTGIGLNFLMEALYYSHFDVANELLKYGLGFPEVTNRDSFNVLKERFQFWLNRIVRLQNSQHIVELVSGLLRINTKRYFLSRAELEAVKAVASSAGNVEIAQEIQKHVDEAFPSVAPNTSVASTSNASSSSNNTHGAGVIAISQSTNTLLRGKSDTNMQGSEFSAGHDDVKMSKSN